MIVISVLLVKKPEGNTKWMKRKYSVKRQVHLKSTN